MKYKLQEGIVKEVICGQTVLIATKEAREHCPYLTQLNDSSAYIWDLLELGRSTEEMLADIVRDYQISEAEAREALIALVNDLEAQNFITKVV